MNNLSEILTTYSSPINNGVTTGGVQ